MTGGPTPSFDEFLASRIHVAESAAIFSAFSFLNLAGYDTENDPEGMHPVRARVRERLVAETPPGLIAKSRAFYRAREARATTHTYAVVATATTGPPDFPPGPGWTEIESQAEYRELAALPSLLRELYTTVALVAIYADVRGAYAKAIAGHLDVVRREVARAMEYCRVESLADLAGHGELERAVVVPNFLEAHERALSFVLGDTFYSVEGPRREPGYNPHEFLHAITNPLTYDLRLAERQERAEPILAAVARTPAGLRFGGKPVPGFVDECFVRALALRYAGRKEPPGGGRREDAITDDDRSGFVLVRFFDEQLAEYEKSNAPLRAYYPLMLRRLDPGREILRWRRGVLGRG